LAQSSMVWTESLPAFGIIAGALALSGFGLEQIHKAFNDGKAKRMRVDAWDSAMISRDAKLNAE